MIIVKVMGGLGNQLYQYAFSEKLKSLGKAVKLDTYDYKYATGDEKEWRELELEWLDKLDFEECTLEEHKLYLDSSMQLKDRVRRKITGRKSKEIAENSDYMPEVLDMDDVYFYGFWACERYYEDILELLRNKITFPRSSNIKNIEAVSKMKNENAVSIHIRRTDYLSVADGKRYMGICTEEYYKSAIEYISSRIDNPQFYIFSDDSEYVKEHYKQENMHIVDWNKGKDSMYDMWLMSCCKHNICANSTFSEWGARLNPNKDKLVIRPLRHDNYEKIDVNKMHENWKRWILIDSDGTIK